MVLLLSLTPTKAGWLGGNVQVRPPRPFVLEQAALTYLMLAKYVRGMYAVRVNGRIPEDVELELERRNIKYRPRDQSDQD